MNDQQLQQLLDQAAERLNVAGAQLALLHDGRLRAFATGLRNREQELPVTHDTLFQVGSTCKVFNAAMVMALVDAGTLKLDVPIKTWIPDLVLSSYRAQEEITLRHLLSMSSGMDNGSYQDYGRWDDAVRSYVAALAGVPHVFEPGTGFGYSNAGSSTAGHVMERATGKTWEALLRALVLDPIGLKQTAAFAEELLFHPLALGYVQSSTGSDLELLRRWALPRSMGPAGGTLCASASDLVRLAKMFLDQGRCDSGKQILSPAAVDEMHTPQVQLPTRLMAQKWGMGPYWKQWEGHTIHGHSGTNLGGSSMLLWCPEKHVAAATTVNVADQGYPLADTIFDTVFPDLFGIRKPAQLTAENAEPVAFEAERYCGRYESLGNVMNVSLSGDKLLGRLDSEVFRRIGLSDSVETEMIPLGEDRFLPGDPAAGGNRGWDVGFWGDDGQGRATNFLNGMFAYRRTG